MARRCDPAPLRKQLNAAGLALPVAWVDLRAAAGKVNEVPDAAWAPFVSGLLYQGATGAFIRWEGSPLPILVELMRELSSAVPILPLAESDIGATGVTPMPIVYKPFLRGREGTLVLTNQSPKRVEVAIELGAEPLEANLLRCAPGRQTSRSHVMPFRFEQEAFDVGRPLIFFKLEAGETDIVNLRLVDPSLYWLKVVEKHKPPISYGPRQDRLSRDAWWGSLLRKAKKLREKAKGKK